MTNWRKKPLSFAGFITAAHAVQTAWHEAGFPVRIIGNLYAAIASHVPVGYEDETGFHYGANPREQFLLIFDSGGQPLFSAGFFTPTSVATVARIGRQGCSELRWLKATVRTIDFRHDILERTQGKKV